MKLKIKFNCDLYHESFFENYNVLREIILRHFHVKADFICSSLYKIYIIHVHLLTEDGRPAITGTSQQYWGLNKSVIMEHCRNKHKHKLLPSSTYCKSRDNPVWTSVFRVEEDFEIETGIICKSDRIE